MVRPSESGSRPAYVARALFEFGHRHVRPQHRPDFCAVAGRRFMATAFAERTYDVLQIALDVVTALLRT